MPHHLTIDGKNRRLMIAALRYTDTRPLRSSKCAGIPVRQAIIPGTPLIAIT